MTGYVYKLKYYSSFNQKTIFVNIIHSVYDNNAIHYYKKRRKRTREEICSFCKKHITIWFLFVFIPFRKIKLHSYCAICKLTVTSHTYYCVYLRKYNRSRTLFSVCVCVHFVSFFPIEIRN